MAAPALPVPGRDLLPGRDRIRACGPGWLPLTTSGPCLFTYRNQVRRVMPNQLTGEATTGLAKAPILSAPVAALTQVDIQPHRTAPHHAQTVRFGADHRPGPKWPAPCAPPREPAGWHADREAGLVPAQKSWSNATVPVIPTW
jgi:hypothetical protein